MPAETPVIPVPTFKQKQEVVVTDGASSFVGRHGTVISTATTVEMSAVAVKFGKAEATVWFHAHQLEGVK
jgi:hypothetical protein